MTAESPIESPPLSTRAIAGLLAYALIAWALMHAAIHLEPLGALSLPVTLAVGAVAFAATGLWLARRAWGRKLLVAFCLVSAFVWLRAWIYAPATPNIFADTPGYMVPPEQSARPFTIPLFFTLLQGGHRTIMAAQIGLSLLAWLSLALALHNAVKPGRRRWAVPGLFLAFSLSHNIVRWDAYMLSESLCHSLIVALAALAVFWHCRVQAGRPVSPGVVAAALLLGLPFLVLLLNTRDTTLYLLPVFVPFFWLYALRYRVPRGFTAVASVVLIGLCAYQNHLAAASWRWKDPLANVMVMRVMPDPEARAYFAAKGMPTDAAMEALAGKHVYNHYAHYQAHEPLQTWLDTRAKPVYIEYLLVRGWASHWVVIRDLPDEFDMRRFVRWHLQDGVGQLFAHPAHWIDRVFFAKVPNLWVPGLWLAALAVLCLALLPHHALGLGVVLALAAAGYVQTFIGYHGDGMDVVRHTLLGQILIRLSFLSTLVVLGLAIAERRPAQVSDLECRQHEGRAEPPTLPL